MKVLFLDIDGVLNDHSFNAESESNTLKPECVAAFNRVLRECEPRVVLSSAWRYMITREVMTPVGFCHMLQTHGVSRLILRCIAGVTAPDEEAPTRGQLIAKWVREAATGPFPVSSYAVVDDMDLGIAAAGHPFVQTDGKIGLTDADADRLIALLNC